MISNVTLDKLKEKFGAEDGFARFREIAQLGGFGTPSIDHTGGVDPAYKGGLDLKGLSEVAGPDRLPDATLNKIQELAGSKAEESDTSEAKTDAKKGKENK